jgi:DNA-binding transcriptional MerR regulator
MFTIGAFAEHGRVSVRMLRHYDAIGLLRPAHVDPASGYRYYRAEQLTQLNRIVALKELGFSLQLVRSILHDDVSADELRGMLRLRRAELESVLADTAARLAEVEARLRTIESEHLMPTDHVVVKSLPPLRVAEVRGTAQSFDPREMGPLVGSLYADLRARLQAAGVVPTGCGVTRYEDGPDGMGVVVLAGLPVAAGAGPVEGAGIVDLPLVEQAATIVHSGPMDRVLPTVQALARWLDAHDRLLTSQHARELSLADEVTELQVPLSGAAPAARLLPPPLRTGE